MKTQIVKFQETELLAVLDENGTPFIAVKPICEAIGLSVDAALRAIRSDEILKDVHTLQYVRDSKNKQNNMLCLPIEYLSGWLFSIETNRVKPEIREKLVAYKKECFAVLFNHFYGSTKKIKDNLQRRYEIRNRMKELNKAINENMKEHKQLEKELEQLEVNSFLQLGLAFEPVQETPKTAFHLKQ